MSMVCRGIRGATTAENTDESIHSATKELLERIVAVNKIETDQIIAAFFTTTQDLNAAFPATAARIGLGWTDVALLDSQAMDVPGSLARCIRVLLLVNTEKSISDLKYVYLRGATHLRSRAADETDD